MQIYLVVLQSNAPIATEYMLPCQHLRLCIHVYMKVRGELSTLTWDVTWMYWQQTTWTVRRWLSDSSNSCGDNLQQMWISARDFVMHILHALKQKISGHA